MPEFNPFCDLPEELQMAWYTNLVPASVFAMYMRYFGDGIRGNGHRQA